MNINSYNQYPGSSPIDKQTRHKEFIPEEINIYNTENINILDIEVIAKLYRIAVRENENITNEELVALNSIKKKIDFEIKNIKNETTGIIAFFKYFFNQKLKSKKQCQMSRLELLGLEFDKKLNNLAKTTLKINTPVLDQTSSLTPAALPQKQENNDNLIPLALTSSFAPPPPPPPLLDRKNLSPEERHLQKETRRLAAKLKARAHPDTFYITTPHKNAAKIDMKIEELEQDVQILSKKIIKNEIIGDLANIKKMISKKEAQIERRKEQLKGSVKVVIANLTNEEFLSKIKNYTNEELKILLGLLYNRKENTPEQQKYHAENKDLIDGILKDWATLSASESGKAFLTHATDWQKYVGTYTHCFISLLKRRLLPNEHHDHLQEPTYVIRPFHSPEEASASTKKLEILEKNPSTRPNLQKSFIGPQDMLTELKNRFKGRKIA